MSDNKKNSLTTFTARQEHCHHKYAHTADAFASHLVFACYVTTSLCIILLMQRQHVDKILL